MQRRAFLTVTAVSIAGLGLGACGDDASGVPAGGVDLGTADDVRRAIEDGGGAWYVPEAHGYVVSVPAEHRDALAAAVDASIRPGIAAGFLALAQKCPHMGCRVPFCDTSGWFECPCHGSRYTRFGELRRGPARRGMSYLPVAVEGDRLRISGDAVDGLRDDVTGVDDPGDHCI